MNGGQRVVRGAGKTVALALIGCGATGLAQSPFTETPILKVDTEQHADVVKKLDVDVDQRRMLSVSDDKTAKLWDLDTGRLLQTLRIPIDLGLEGQLFVGALQPGGRLAAVGGYTAIGTRSVFYFFDLDSGRLVAQLAAEDDEPPWVVHNLRFSPNGRFLAAALGAGNSGFYALRIYDLGGGAPELIAEHREFAGPLHGIDFSARGDLAVTSLDGSLHVFTAESRYARGDRLALDAAAEPMHVRFAPDSSSVVVGFNAVPKFSIIAVPALRVAHTSDPAALPEQRGLHVVDWSSNGESVYAGGEPQGTRRSALYRFANAGRGAFQAIDVASQLLTDLHRLPDGDMLFSTADPQITRLSAAGVPVWSRTPEIPDHRYDVALFAVSHDGRVVQFAYDPEGERVASFSVSEPEERALRIGRAVTAQVRAARQSAAGWDVRDWRDGYAPTINGARAALDDLERTLSMAIAPDSETVLLGTRWALRRYDRSGTLIAQRRLASAAHHVSFSGDGAWVLAALSDGTIRWFRSADLSEALGLFPHADGREWIAWTPDGLYTSSLRGDELIGWHLNTPLDVASGIVGEPDFFKAIQFERELFRMGLAASALAANVAPSAGVPPLREILPPRVRIAASAEGNVARIVVDAEATGLPMQDLAVYLNGIPITPSAERSLSDGESGRLIRELDLALPQRANDLRVEIFNGRSMGLAERYVAAPVDLPTAKGDLYVLSIGINTFQNPSIRALNFAVNDARRFQEYFATLQGSLFANVRTLMLTDDSPMLPTKANIIAALDFIKAATGQDTVIVTLASHGLSDERGNYYFVPIDADVADGSRVRANADDVPSFVSWRTFFDALRVTAGRRLLLVDTCESSDMEGSFDVYALAKRSAASSFALMTASQGDQKSQEYLPQGAPMAQGQGLFTYAVLKALEVGVDADRDGVTTLREVFNHAFPLVQELHRRATGPQTPELVDPPPLDRIPLGIAQVSSLQEQRP